MRYRPLGQSGIEASVVGVGTWAIGGWMWGGTDEQDSIQAVHAAIDSGVNLIDTAPVYGFGLSEEIVGRAIRDRRDKVVIATKCGMVCNPGVGASKFRVNTAGPSEHGLIHVQIHLAPDSIRQEVEDSLQRLGTDHIDLYQTHWQDPTTAIEDTMATLMKLKEQGKIRAIGVSNATSEQMDAYRWQGPLDSDQEKYSMLDQDIEADRLPYCREKDIAVLAYSPLAQGLLTGKMDPSREFPEGDLRRDNERFSRENRERVTAMLNGFKPIAEARGLTLAQLTIAWTVHQPGLTHALVGARNPKQAQENAAAGDVVLADDVLSRMNEIIDEHVAVVA
jgi:aryl-alcohol dehydrogenase-like predicted oxidoreductase